MATTIARDRTSFNVKPQASATAARCRRLRLAVKRKIAEPLAEWKLRSDTA
jgi:hypothetical protein